MSEVALLLLALALTLACAVFVAAEFSLTTIERSELERAVKAGERGAESALKAAKRLTFQLSGAQLGITVTSLIIGMLAEPSLAVLLRGPLEGAGLPAGAVSTVATLLGVAASTVVLMVIGELVPKNWAISSPLTVAKVVSTPQRAFTACFAPLIRHLNNTANRFVRRLGLEPAEELASARTPQELIALAQHSAREGAIEQDSAELFVRTLHLAELSAENVMTPRVDVRALEAHATAADAANLTLATGLSRFPVYRDSLDEVIGTVHIRDVLALDESERAGTPVTALATEPLLVPVSLPVDRLLAQLRKRRTMAVVIDEYGGTA
ncbi:hemolysin family protein, partial [Streptomyces anulatus]|uniref:hemolysin family protein n=1 Tax=Streptomyces anulatus TaxID=1892 RepID=UPI00364A820E